MKLYADGLNDGNAKIAVAPSPWRRWGGLASGVLLIWLFMFVLAPWVRTYPPVTEVLDCVRENDIDASALFYTEIEEFSEAELAIRESMKRR